VILNRGIYRFRTSEFDSEISVAVGVGGGATTWSMLQCVVAIPCDVQRTCGMLMVKWVRPCVLLMVVWLRIYRFGLRTLQLDHENDLNDAK